MTINKIRNNKLFFIFELLCLVLGPVMTIFLVVVNTKIVKKTSKTHFRYIFMCIPFVGLFIYSLLNRMEGNPVYGLNLFFAFLVCNVCLICFQYFLLKGELLVSESRYNSKQLIVIGGISFAVFFVVIVAALCINAESNQIQDGNGDSNFQLETITDYDLTSMEISFVADSVEHGKYGKRSGASISDESDYDEIEYSSKRASGVRFIQSTLCRDSVYKMTVENSISKGNCKIVLVSNGTILEEFEPNSKKTVEIPDATNKEFHLILGCESADIKIHSVRYKTGDKTG